MGDETSLDENQNRMQDILKNLYRSDDIIDGTKDIIMTII